MNHTKNYSLPQWELNDLIKMEDFNGAMANIESGIDGAKAEAKAAAEDLDRRVKAADVKASSKPYVTGSYTGNGDEIVINLGFRPSFVIVCGMLEAYDSSDFRQYIHYTVMTAGNIAPHRVSLTDTGFIARSASYGGYGWPYMTSPGRVYDYIAFK